MERKYYYYGGSFFTILLLFSLWFGIGLFSAGWLIFFIIIASTPTVYVYYEDSNAGRKEATPRASTPMQPVKESQSLLF